MTPRAWRILTLSEASMFVSAWITERWAVIPLLSGEGLTAWLMVVALAAWWMVEAILSADRLLPPRELAYQQPNVVVHQRDPRLAWPMRDASPPCRHPHWVEVFSLASASPVEELCTRCGAHRTSYGD